MLSVAFVVFRNAWGSCVWVLQSLKAKNVGLLHLRSVTVMIFFVDGGGGGVFREMSE